MDKLKAEVTIYTIKSEISNFDWEQYIANYPDLKKAGINNKIKALNHYNNFGKKEYRSFKKI